MQISKLSLCIGGVGILAIFARYGMTQDAFDSAQEPQYADAMPGGQGGYEASSPFDDASLDRGTYEESDLFDDFGMTARTIPPTRNPGPMRERTITRTVHESILVPIPAEEIATAKRLQDALVLLNNSKDDDAREKAKNTIQDQLQLQFQNDLKKREAELLKVEKRVETLREQFDKRKAAQDDIIKLRLQTLVNEASGLGFPPSYSARPYTPDAFFVPESSVFRRTGDNERHSKSYYDDDLAVPAPSAKYPSR